jgi:REP element-mobilizing transposase RayT
LVEGKHSWATPEERSAAKQGFRSWHERGYLPHRDAPGLTQFVTIRLVDSFPGSRRREWEALVSIEDQSARRRKLESYLDRGLGECWLRRTDLAALVQDAFLFFHGSRYEIRAWVVMPNHAHVLVRITNTPLSRVLQRWKRHSAREANRRLGREGAFWAEDYWDTYMRDADHEVRAREYIECNPVKARLAHVPSEWAWSSARLRDEYQQLLLPPKSEPPPEQT